MKTALKILKEANGFWQTRFFPFCHFGSFFMPWKKFPSVNHEISVPCQTQWKIKVDTDNRDVKLVKKDPDLCQGKTVKSFLLREEPQNPEDNKFKDKVLVYVHGGGFVTNSTGTCMNYLPSFCKKMPGLTIISVEVSLSPQVRFPTQIQETLDVCLWLQDAYQTHSSYQSAKDLLGFTPSSFIFAGDSCGAQILMSTLFVMNDINRVTSLTEKLILPERFIGLFPTFHSTPTMTPAFLLSMKDLALFSTTLVAMSVCYLPKMKGVPDPVEESLKSESGREISWHLQNKENLSAIFCNYSWLYLHPYFSQFEYQHFEDLRDVELNVFCGQDDPLFDMGIIILKYWRGKKTLDVARGLKHAYLFFMAHSRVFFRSKVTAQITRQEDIIVSRISGAHSSEYRESE
jgi:hypothetical protein